MSTHSQKLPSNISSNITEAPQTTPISGPATPNPHELECLIQRGLQSRAGLKFSRLVVHKFGDCVCLEGLLEENQEGLDLCEVVNEIAGVKAINRVVARSATPK
jgi:hypothetical protein